MIFTPKKIFHFRAETILVIFWLVVQLFICWQKGIEVDYEAEKYISQAHHVLEYGQPESRNYFLYSTEIYMIAFSLKTGLGFYFVVLIQLWINLLATNAFFRLSKTLLGNSLLPLITTILFIGNVVYQQYNFYLFTESLFYSLIIIFTASLLNRNHFTPGQIVQLSFLLGLLCVTRPTGVLLLVPTACFMMFWLSKRNNFYLNLSIVLLMATGFLLVLNELVGVGGTLDFLKPFRNENIICGVDTVPSPAPNSDLYDNSLAGLLAYISAHPAQVLRLAWLRSIAFFAMVRSYFSMMHNLYLVLFFYPFYLLFFPGIKMLWKDHGRALIFLLGVIAVFWITTMVTCDDWHNRFITTVTPFFILIGMASFKNFFRKKKPVEETGF